jgi:hypothetical protein
MISRDLLHPESRGLQVIEGRMRTGILQGRRSGDLHVADSHQAWSDDPADPSARRLRRRAAAIEHATDRRDRVVFLA